MNIGKFFGREKDQAKLDAFRMAAGYQPPRERPAAPPPPKGSSVTFEKTRCDDPRRLTTSEGEGPVTGWEEVADALDRLLDGELEFVILTAGEAPQGIRFVQCCPAPEEPGRVLVELNLEEPGSPRSRLVERDCDETQCFDAFRKFFQTGGVPEREKYRPVEF